VPEPWRRIRSTSRRRWVPAPREASSRPPEKGQLLFCSQGGCFEEWSNARTAQHRCRRGGARYTTPNIPRKSRRRRGMPHPRVVPQGSMPRRDGAGVRTCSFVSVLFAIHERKGNELTQRQLGRRSRCYGCTGGSRRSARRACASQRTPVYIAALELLLSRQAPRENLQHFCFSRASRRGCFPLPPPAIIFTWRRSQRVHAAPPGPTHRPDTSRRNNPTPAVGGDRDAPFDRAHGPTHAWGHVGQALRWPNGVPGSARAHAPMQRLHCEL